MLLIFVLNTVCKVSKYGDFSAPYFFVFGLHMIFSPNMGKYRPEKPPYLDTFHTIQS